MQKFAARLDGGRFQNVTSIALYKNFCFVNAVTYLCFICNNFVRKSIICALSASNYIHLCYCRDFKTFIITYYA